MTARRGRCQAPDHCSTAKQEFVATKLSNETSGRFPAVFVAQKAGILSQNVVFS